MPGRNCPIGATAIARVGPSIDAGDMHAADLGDHMVASALSDYGICDVRHDTQIAVDAIKCQ